MNRLIKSLATVMGAAAIILAPMALLAPSAQAAIVLDESNTDDVVAFSSDANKIGYWVTYLANKGITGATCVYVDGDNEEEWVIPAPPTGTKFVLVTTKAGAGDSANLVWWAPKAAQGNTVTAVEGKQISHLIWCTVPLTTTPHTPPADNPPTSTPPADNPPTSTPPAGTPPVVETDRVDGGSGAGLGLFGAAAALLLGAGAIVIGRRRQGDHR